MNILFTAAGRRVEMIEIFQKELPEDKIFVADVVNSAPALYVSQNRFVIKKFSDPECLENLLETVQKHSIDVIIPLIDPEIDFYRVHRASFEKKGIRILLPSDQVVDIARDKWQTYNFFKKHQIPAAQTYQSAQEIRKYPIAAKLKRGSAGVGLAKILDPKELLNRLELHEGYIYQEWLLGDEITVDIIGDGQGNCVALSQRKRLKIRSGEVERAVTIFDPIISDYVQKIVDILKPWGAINLQLFKTPDGSLSFQEINARLGGGCPLTYRAGIPVPQLVKDIVTGQYKYSKTAIAKVGICMLRYDSAFYMQEKNLYHG